MILFLNKVHTLHTYFVATMLLVRPNNFPVTCFFSSKRNTALSSLISVIVFFAYKPIITITINRKFAS